MDLVVIVLVLVSATYAINTLKIRMVLRARPLSAAALEGAQGFMYVYVLVRVLESANSMAGIAAYVVGAAAGTFVAMVFHQRSAVDIPGHYHACCPPVGPLPLPATSAVEGAIVE